MCLMRGLTMRRRRVGYEIPFNRHFYVFKPPRELAEIDAELKGVTDRIVHHDRGTVEMSFPNYSDMHESGIPWIGKIPIGWDVVQGRRLFVQKRDPSEPEDEQLSATQKYGVLPQSKFMELEDQKVTLALSGLDNFKHVQVDDFVISLRSFQGGIEHSAYSGCVSPAYTILRPNHSVHPPFWKYLMKSRGYIEALQSVTDGIRDGKNISYEQFGMVFVPDVPTDEQKSISSFLDAETSKIDALIAEQRRLIELMKEKRQAVISHAVTKGLHPNAPMKPLRH
jgi:type I restriction enzyme S subunit